MLANLPSVRSQAAEPTAIVDLPHSKDVLTKMVHGIANPGSKDVNPDLLDLLHTLVDADTFPGDGFQSRLLSVQGRTMRFVRRFVLPPSRTTVTSTMSPALRLSKAL